MCFKEDSDPLAYLYSLGPVVHSIVSLTVSLRGQLVKLSVLQLYKQLH